MRDVWLRVNQGTHMAISCVHIHPHVTCSLGKRFKRDWVCLSFVCPRFSWAVLGLMSTSGNVREKHWAIGPGFCSAAVHFFSLCSRNGRRQWLDVADLLFFFLSDFLHFCVLNFKEGAWEEPPERNHSTPLKAACPSDHPSLCSRPLKRSLTSFGSTAVTSVIKKKKEKRRRVAFFQAWNIHSALSWLISKKMSAVLFAFVCLFVRSFFYLPYCSYKTYRWVDECIVLLLLTCLRLYGFAVSMFFFFLSEGRGGREESLV